MVLHVGKNQYLIQALFDTGFSVPLVNLSMGQKLRLPMFKYDPAICIENFTGCRMEEYQQKI